MKKIITIGTTIIIVIVFVSFYLFKFHLGFLLDIHKAYLTLEKNRPTIDQIETAVEQSIPEYLSIIEINIEQIEQTPIGLRIDCSVRVSVDMDIFKVASTPILQNPEELKSIDLIPKDLREMAIKEIENTVFIPLLPSGMSYDYTHQQIAFRQGEEIQLKAAVRASENSLGGWTLEAEIEDAPWSIKTPGTYLKTALQMANDRRDEILAWEQIWRKYLELEQHPKEKQEALRRFAEQKKKQPPLSPKHEMVATIEKATKEKIKTNKEHPYAKFEPCFVKVAFFRAAAVYRKTGTDVTIRITRTLRVLSYTIPEGTRAFGKVIKNDGRNGMDVQFTRAILPRGTIVKFNKRAKIIPI